MTDSFCKQSIEENIKDDINVVFYEKTDSTMVQAKRIINEKSFSNIHKTVVVATEQTTGKGRLGRSFYSPGDGGIYFSVILSDGIIENPAIITASVATAVCRAIKAIYDKDCKIKWVNDILLNHKKICGILTEGIINPVTNKIDTAIVGIGINIFVDAKDVPVELQNIIGGIVENPEQIKKTQLLCSVVENIFDIFSESKNVKNALVEYKKKSALIGKKIKVFPVIGQMDNFYYCFVEDISEDAKLIVRTENNEVKYLDSGEVSIFSKTVTE